MPGAAVTFTLIQSESTVVPPVTAERSPPDSRMTGADSPVIADSLTEAMPSIDLAIGRDDLAGLDHHEVADRKIERRDLLEKIVALVGLQQAAWPSCRCGCGARHRPAPCPALRPPLRRNWRTAR